ncbi:hypothetical protein GCM10027521_47370 [Amycolatopsis cihanbeyliensis]
MTVRLAGSAEELRRLAAWLRDEDDLRGRVRLQQRPTEPGEMGSLADVLVVVLASGGVVNTTVKSVFAWLRHRRDAQQVSLIVRCGDTGEELDLQCGSANDAEQLVDRATRFLDRRA